MIDFVPLNVPSCENWQLAFAWDRPSLVAIWTFLLGYESEKDIKTEREWFPKLTCCTRNSSGNKLVSWNWLCRASVCENSSFSSIRLGLKSRHASLSFHHSIYQSLFKLLEYEEGRIKIHVQQHVSMIVWMFDVLLFAVIIMKRWYTRVSSKPANVNEFTNEWNEKTKFTIGDAKRINGIKTFLNIFSTRSDEWRRTFRWRMKTSREIYKLRKYYFHNLYHFASFSARQWVGREPRK